MVAPDPSDAPVIPPVIGPTVQVKLLEALAVRLIFVLVPLQVFAVLAVVTAGAGSTFMVMVKAVPIHAPVDEVGVTI